MEQVSNHCYAVLNEKNRVCDANSGVVNDGSGMVVDTQSDLPHARRMIELFSRVWSAMPGRVVNTHEDSDHVYGNQLFPGSEIIGHRSLPDRMKEGAEPAEIQKLMRVADGTLTGTLLKMIHPGVVSAARQL
jgi:cyclase